MVASNKRAPYHPFCRSRPPYAVQEGILLQHLFIILRLEHPGALFTVPVSAKIDTTCLVSYINIIVYYLIINKFLFVYIIIIT